MSFSTDIAESVANQLARFVTLNRHQLAGQAANLDFWLDQVRNALAAIDGYGVRFVRMTAAQEQYTATHETTEFAFGADHHIGARAAPPRRVPERELQKARRALVEAAAAFLHRCRDDDLISDAQLGEALGALGAERG